MATSDVKSIFLLLLALLAGVAARDASKCDRFTAPLLKDCSSLFKTKATHSDPRVIRGCCKLAEKANKASCFCRPWVLDAASNVGISPENIQSYLTSSCKIEEKKLQIQNVHGCGLKDSRRGMFVFGDSYLDTDTPLGVVTPPYGQTNPGRPNGRLSDGLILTDFAAKHLKLGGSPLPFAKLTPKMPVPRYGINFASTGSGVSNLAFQNVANNLSAQVTRFENLVASRRIKKKAVADAFFLINSGGNDVRGAFLKGLFQNASASFGAELQVTILDRVKEAVKRLRQAGATKFIFGGTNYPAACIPVFTRAVNFTSCLPPQLVPDGSLFEQGEREIVATLNKERKVRAVLLDLDKIYATISTSQSCYGFNDVLKPCCTGPPPQDCGSLDKNGNPLSTVCATPGKSFWWDSVHPTNAGYAEVAALAFRGSGFTVPGPNVCDVLQVQCAGSPPPSCPSA